MEKEKDMVVKKDISKPLPKAQRGIDSSSSEAESDDDSSETLSESEDDIEDAEEKPQEPQKAKSALQRILETKTAAGSEKPPKTTIMTRAEVRAEGLAIAELNQLMEGTTKEEGKEEKEKEEVVEKGKKRKVKGNGIQLSKFYKRKIKIKFKKFNFLIGNHFDNHILLNN